MKEWKECKLGEVVEIIGGGTPKTSVAEYWNGAIPWLSVVDFNTGKKYVETTEKSITELGFKNSSTKILNKNDIIISARGTVGAIAVLKNKMAFNQSCYGIRNMPNRTDNDFLYYLLKDSIDNFKQIAHGGVFDTITRETFNLIDILLPPLPEQRAIANVLSSLDDKIDLLHRQNKTLEAMAETLFRQWFVEEASEEWEEVKLGDLVEIKSGKGLKKDSFIDSGLYPILGANGEIGRTNDFLFNDKLLYTGRVGTLGNIFRIINKKVWLSDNTLIIKPLKYFNYIYFILKFACLEELNVGSTQPLIRQSDVKEIDVVFPQEKSLEFFEKISDIFFNKIESNSIQIRTLSNLRDTLLPKLMSGEVRVEI